MSKTHELKTVQPYFDQVWSGVKTAELRKNDRGFAVGDYLVLRELLPCIRCGGYSCGKERYTGRAVIVRVTCITEGHDSLTPGYAMLSFKAHSQTYDYKEGDGLK